MGALLQTRMADEVHAVNNRTSLYLKWLCDRGNKGEIFSATETYNIVIIINSKWSFVNKLR